VVNRQIFFPYHEANLDFLVVLPAAYSQYWLVCTESCVVHACTLWKYWYYEW
jgi:hypothetical protein